MQLPMQLPMLPQAGWLGAPSQAQQQQQQQQQFLSQSQMGFMPAGMMAVPMGMGNPMGMWMGGGNPMAHMPNNPQQGFQMQMPLFPQAVITPAQPFTTVDYMRQPQQQQRGPGGAAPPGPGPGPGTRR